ncbi:MAG: LysR family transcriptional regulator [Isosphaeraceae bacterium]|nr:LysR family transcriptional regulator [Isosphaeraceae bacterium]
MQIETLKIFCDVVAWANFSRGAQANSVSQSTASQAVQQLEGRLGVKLIDRSKRPFVLTPAGKTFYEGCKEIVGRYAELETRVRAFDRQEMVVGTVRVCSIYSAGLNHIKQFVGRFREMYPAVTVELEYLHPKRVVESVADGEADLGLISFPRRWADLNVLPWREEEMVLVVPPSHRFACRSSVSVRELEGETLIGFDHDLSIRRAIDRFLREHDLDLEVAHEFDNIENIKRAVETELGVAVLPRPTLAAELRAGTLAAVAFSDASLVRPLAIIHRRSEALGSSAAKFLDLLRSESDSAPKPVASLEAAMTASTAAAPAEKS